MGRLNLNMVFRQTTSEKIKCKFCFDNVNGEDGYIKVNIFASTDGYYGGRVEKRAVVCNKCFNKYINNITKAKKNKKESYNKLVKTKILKSLR